VDTAELQAVLREQGALVSTSDLAPVGTLS